MLRIDCRAVLLLPVFLLQGFQASLADADYARGELLYENHCRQCHEANVHQRDSRRVTSADELRIWVTAWGVHAAPEWSDDDIMDVAHYLEVNFYHFPPEASR